MLAPEDKFITIDGLTLHYLDWGNREATPMILLHGLCSNAHYWDFFARNICNYYHILAVDQRGHGDSNWAGSYGPRDYIADLETFIDELRLNDSVLIGHSMGGINAVLYAARNPERVAKLVIIDIGPEIGAEGAERMLQEMIDEPESFASLEEAVNYLRTLQPRYPDDFLQHQIKHAFTLDEQGRFAFKFDRVLRNTEMRSPEWLWEYLEQIICPVLLLHGIESDVLLDGIAHRMGETLLFGSVVDMEHAGHSIPGDNPQAFETAMRNFLDIPFIY